LNVDGSLAVADQHKAGTLVFKTILDAESIVALIAVEENRKPTLKFVTQPLPAGSEQIIRRNDRTYGYVREDLKQSVRFCALSGKNEASIEHGLKRLNNVWRTLPDEACVKFGK